MSQIINQPYLLYEIELCMMLTGINCGRIKTSLFHDHGDVKIALQSIVVCRRVGIVPRSLSFFSSATNNPLHQQEHPEKKEKKEKKITNTWKRGERSGGSSYQGNTNTQTRRSTPNSRERHNRSTLTELPPAKGRTTSSLQSLFLSLLRLFLYKRE